MGRPTHRRHRTVCLSSCIAAFAAARFVAAQAPAHAGPIRASGYRVRRAALFGPLRRLPRRARRRDAGRQSGQRPIPPRRNGSRSHERHPQRRAGHGDGAERVHGIELGALVAYLRNMSSVSLSAVKLGDATRGRALFVGKGNCGSCHRVGADGPRAAPDLTSIGATAPPRRSSARCSIRTSRCCRPIGRCAPCCATARSSRAGGSTRTRSRCSSSTRTNGSCRSIEPRFASTRSAREATMPSYADVFSADERADLVAYLLSLKGPKLMRAHDV